jgi:hypothetical protein
MTVDDNFIDLTESSPAGYNTPKPQLQHKYNNNEKSSRREWLDLSPSLLLSSPLARFSNQPPESILTINDEANQSSDFAILNDTINDDIGISTNGVGIVSSESIATQDNSYNLTSSSVCVTPIRYDDIDHFWIPTIHSRNDIVVEDSLHESPLESDEIRLMDSEDLNLNDTPIVLSNTPHQDIGANTNLTILSPNTSCSNDVDQIINNENQTRKKTRKQMVNK